MTGWHSAIALLVGILFVAIAASAEEVEKKEARVIPFLDRWEARVYKNEKNETLPYRLLRPKGYEAKQAYPLVVFLHGMGERGSDNEVQLVNGVSELFASDAAIEKFPAVVIVPQCPDGEDFNTASWANWRSDTFTLTTPTRLVLEIVEALQKEFNIDANRLYLGGLSMGGFGTWNVIQMYPHLFAAAFPICGGGDPSRVKELATMPIWIFQGAIDDTVPPRLSREMVQALQAAGGHPGYCEFPGVGHNSWTNAFEEPRLLPWLFGQKKSATTEK